MKLYILTTAFFATFFLISCKKDNEVNLSKTDYIIFGHFYGECIGEQCVKIFKLDKEKLFEDTKRIYPTGNSFYEGRFDQLPKEKFDITKDLTNYFPMSLLKEEKTVIGQPDAGDWGGIYVEYNANGLRKFWLLDKKKSNVPTKYHNFIDKVSEKIAQL